MMSWSVVSLLVVGVEALARPSSQLRATPRPPAQEAVPKREMLRFYGPALGIFLANPLMSNIDNAIVGRAAGVEALAALSPGTVLSDQVLFLFSFLGRATTGLVSRANAKSGISGARDELRRPLAFAFAIGVGLLVPMYVLATPAVLGALRVAPELKPPAAAYARIRGVAAPLALCQSVALSALLALRDAATPLRVVLGAAALNLVGDLALCCWPLQLGVSGAAAATSASTAAGAYMMLRALRNRGMLDDDLWWRDYLSPRRFTALKRELGPLFSYAGPLSAIVVTRLLGFAAMQVCAASFGTQHLAAYQIALNVFVLFAFFAEPLSQTAQAVCPPLVDGQNALALAKTILNLATLALLIGPLVAAACATFLRLAAPAMTSDPGVLEVVKGTIPAVFATVLQLFLTTTLDGCIVGARDFKWIVGTGTCTCVLQLAALRAIASRDFVIFPPLALIFSTFTARLFVYALASTVRVLLGFGPLGRALRPRYAPVDQKNALATSC
ncbi:hypothetical protein CTAYLR_010785 [Chrysophaeum taylorii]|uniref:Protein DETOXIFICATION n=1 Tax=Chrysophaeum taylorii TaxID=2483200 RepID=A0AAD7UHU1_9STRA|nr:hypothetical protein CTAYLR_010785 [Chrysophaeum taylorii]